ncbi:MAG: toxin [Elusimicrobia bacterium CG03_land_8_20_14_0_80_50_18]|nr:MAG: toxin [Elusimicrobia bacterium CG03_land_8_20_14_0_80_50_18]PIX14254.1 MAG: toxin [Elusimicrobia bacterium CG_4_8_14_3_um_filter_50_9]
MKYFDWNPEKNKWLIEKRNISFEQVVFYIEKGGLLDIIENTKRETYKNQKMFVLQMDKYVYLVPFVEDNRVIFLKTVIPSRKATKKYLK